MWRMTIPTSIIYTSFNKREKKSCLLPFYVKFDKIWRKERDKLHLGERHRQPFVSKNNADEVSGTIVSIYMK